MGIDQMSHAPYIFIFTSLCLMLIIRTRSWVHHKLPLIIIGYFYILLSLKLLGVDYFRVIHDCLVFILVITSYRLYDVEKYEQNNKALKFNIIPYIMILLYGLLEIIHIHLPNLFYVIHAIIIVMILLLLIGASLYLIYCKQHDIKSKIILFVY